MFPFAMDHSIQSDCDCNDCYFVKNELLLILIRNIHNSPPIEPPVVIMFIHMTHNRNMSNKIFTTNSVLNVSIYINTLHKESAGQYYIVFEIKVPHDPDIPEAQRLLNNEMQFYKNIQNFVRCDPFPKCYFADNIPKEIVQRPIIVLENLMAHGYAIEVDKLDKDGLYKYMKILGLFHAETFRMQEDNPDYYRRLVENLRFESECQVKIRQELAVRDFLRSSQMNDLHSVVKMEITEKLQKVKHLENCIYSTIIHSSFTRDAVMKKNVGKDENVGRCTWDDMKIIGFQKIRVGPPVIDLGRILFTNLPDEYHVSSLKMLFCEMTSMYIESLLNGYSSIRFNYTTLQQEIYNNLLFSYIHLESDERQAIGEPTSLLICLNEICKY